MMIIYLILLMAGAVMIIYALLLKKKAEQCSREIDALSQSCQIYEAVVLDVHRERLKTTNGKERVLSVIILSFRIEEQKRTVICRMQERFYKPYSRSDTVRLYFREEMPVDKAVLYDDNYFTHTIALKNKLYLPLMIIGGIFSAAAVTGMIL